MNVRKRRRTEQRGGGKEPLSMSETDNVRKRRRTKKGKEKIEEEPVSMS
jgi:hypothetical protein